jgi:hypothetical protein
MFHRIRAALPPGLPRTPAGFIRSTSKSSISGLALACLLLLAGCAGAGGRPPLASDQSSPPKAASAEAQATADGSSTSSVATLDPSPALLQRRRQAIARMLEANEGYRTTLDDGVGKLTNARIAGPIKYIHRRYYPTGVTVYCVTADVGFPFFGRDASIMVDKAGTASERLLATIDILNTTLYSCMGAYGKYEPFPEMEQLRAERRKALGKPD